MRPGQTSIIVFASKVVGSVLAFLATIFFARVVGAEVLGIYGLVLTLVAWLQLGGTMGVGTAVTKRLSEGEERGEHLAAGLLTAVAFGLVISAGVVLAQPYVEAYVGAFDAYVAVSVVWFVVALLFIRLFYKVTLKTLEGEHKVHIAGLLDPVKFGTRSLVQITLVLAGFGLLGMLVGYAAGGILIGVIGVACVSTSLRRPRRRHFRSVYDYAKFSWLGNLQSRTFNDVDVLVLGVFVGEALIGVYVVVWSLAKFLNLFATAIRDTLFPEISQKSQDGLDAASGLVEDSLAFAGLVAIPGLVGGVLLADRIMLVYGPEFAEGTTILGLLIFAVLLYAYQKQLSNALNAVDRPDLSFRINIVFIVTNAGLNLALIPTLGLVGAAIASVASTFVGAILSYAALTRLVDFTAPVGDVGRQVAAALVMGGVVYSARALSEGTMIAVFNEMFVALLVGLGAATYFLVLLVISARFRKTAMRNLPVDVLGR
ncbi:lipopolysaccharide biosynthesis protein [Halorubrum gandharaense]